MNNKKQHSFKKKSDSETRESTCTVALIDSASRNMILKIFENFKGLF
jgi:hypothetical protein